MSIPYNEWRYLFPPRTESKIPWKDDVVLPCWRNFPDSIAQYKLNGNRNLIAVSPTGTIRFWTRHINKATGLPEEQKYDIPDLFKQKILAAVPSGSWSLIDSELMHTKAVEVKNVLYVYDVLVWGGQYLVGEDYLSRTKNVDGKFDGSLPIDELLAGNSLPHNNIYVAKNIPAAEWDNAWEVVKRVKFIEGLVLKRTGAVSRLEESFSVINNNGWMCRIRKANKNSLF